ncbi:cupin domain-containing protein [Uliginosibacterium gangwonense]|uniref:cupin domain-containing protein n=1 Tax=Uliginosibacterium gangwonense TaxID=392736 RepID=UPI000361D3E7|nr:cupin domain-containing protein [Uliginosibacterium gangwonense]
MMRCLLLASLMSLSSLAWSADAAGVQSELLLKTQQSWDGKTYPAYPAGQPEVTLLRITIPPHTALDWHQHPIINVGYMLAGTLVVENQVDGSTKTLHAGDPLPELVGTVHRGTNPGDEPATILVFYAGVVGSPLSTK